MAICIADSVFHGSSPVNISYAIMAKEYASHDMSTSFPSPNRHGAM